MARNSRSNFRRGISETQRRKKTWEGIGLAGADEIGVTQFVGSPSIGSPTLSIVSLTSQDAGSLVEGTLLRLRGSLILPKSIPGSAAAASVVAFGIGFVTDDAGNAAAVPNPATTIGADWDGWLFYRSNVAAALDANATILDSKAMRKWGSGMSLALIVGAATSSASPPGTQEVSSIIRALFLLP